MPPRVSLTEANALASREGPQRQLHHRELAGAAGLPHVPVAHARRGLRGHAQRHPRRARADLQPVPALQPLDVDLQVQLTHAAEQGLTRTGVGPHLQRRIFCLHLRQHHAQARLVFPAHWLDGQLDDGRRELHRLEDHQRSRTAERVAGARLLRAHQRAELTCHQLVDLDRAISLQLEQPPDPLALPGPGEDQQRAGPQGSAVHAHPAQGAHVLVGDAHLKTSAVAGPSVRQVTSSLVPG